MPNRPGPFGFEKGMTKEQIIVLVGKDAVDEKKSTGNVLVLNTAPKANPDFDSYTLTISPKKGLYSIEASGKPIFIGDEGGSLRRLYNLTVAAIANKYGAPYIDDERCPYMLGNPCSQTETYLKAMRDDLYKENHSSSAIWDIRKEQAVNSVITILVDAKPLSTDSCHIPPTLRLMASKSS